MGVITPLGNALPEFWEGLSTGRSGVAAFAPEDGGAAFACAGRASDFTGHIDDFGPLDPTRKRAIRKGLKLMCREIQMGVAAAQRALHHARLEPGGYDPDRSGVIYGCDHIVTRPEEFAAAFSACLDEAREFHFGQWGTKGLAEVSPLWLLKYLPNMPASHVAIYNDLRGANNSLTYREASANIALGEAAATIGRGAADCVVAGSTGSSISALRAVQLALHSEWAQNGEAPATVCRPFDARRTGMVAGEGAVAVVLEERQHAQARGAEIFGEVLGFGSSLVVDDNSVADHAQALVNAMQQALASAGGDIAEVGHLHAHGSGARHGDLQEARAISEVFGTRASPIPVTAAKSYFGNLGAASGLAELVASLLAIRHGPLFPILNCQQPDPRCELRLVTTAGTPAGDSVLNVNFTPQGQASAVLVRGATSGA